MRALLVLALLVLTVALDPLLRWSIRPTAAGLAEGNSASAQAASRPSPTPRPAKRRAAPVASPKPAQPSPDAPELRPPGPEPAGHRGRPVTLRGEIVEMAGYLRDGRRGAGHRGESLAAVQAGGALALVEDDTGDLYLLAGDTPASNPNELARDLVAEHVVATGKSYERAGCRVFVPTAIDRLDR